MLLGVELAGLLGVLGRLRVMTMHAIRLVRRAAILESARDHPTN
jgi:hypothetical protein